MQGSDEKEKISKCGITPPESYFIRDYMGLTPLPNFDVIAKSDKDIANALYQRTNAYSPWRQAASKERELIFGGTKFAKRKNDPNFYKMWDYFRAIGDIDILTNIIIDSEGGMKYFKLATDPIKRKFYYGPRDERKARVGEYVLPAAFMLRAHYASIYTQQVSGEGKVSYTMTMRMYKQTAKEKAAIGRAKMEKLRMGKKPRVSVRPYRYPFQYQGYFMDERAFFAATNTWASLCGLVKPGEFFDMAAGLGVSRPYSPGFVQTALVVKSEPLPHIEVIMWWDDPPFPPSRKESRMFLLFGLVLDIIGTPRDRKGKLVRPGLVKHCFLALECPTPGVMRLPVFAPGLPLYRKEVYDLWRQGLLRGLRIGGQFHTILQTRPGFGVIPASTLSLMPEPELFFIKPHTIKWEGNL